MLCGPSRSRMILFSQIVFVHGMVCLFVFPRVHPAFCLTVPYFVVVVHMAWCHDHVPHLPLDRCFGHALRQTRVSPSGHFPA